MNSGRLNRKVVFETPWFRVCSEQSPDGKPHYTIDSADFVAIVATNADGELLLVRQYRPAIRKTTLELPAGHIDAGETPEEAARKELFEETGHVTNNLEPVATLSPSTARFTNRLHVFYAANIRQSTHERYKREQGVDFVFHRGGLRELLDVEGFVSMGSCGALFAAVARGKLRL